MDRTLRHGWTTGSCATAATRAAFEALVTDNFPDPVTIALPGGGRPAFALACTELGADFARAGVVKDAGDDPDVTHGALILSTLRRGTPGSGIVFRAGPGVGTVTRPGLMLAPGEPAINPVPRRMMIETIQEAAHHHGCGADAIVEIAIPDGETIALKTLNGRLGIVGGLSILGTTGIVVPYSCSAWIHSIHRGVDVARATGIRHIAGATGATSEAAVQQFHGLPDAALIDMGDFVGGLLKYLRSHPVETITIAGGFAKMTKLGQGLLDLHSRRGAVDFAWLGAQVGALGGDPGLIANVNTAKEAWDRANAAGIDLAAAVADSGWHIARAALDDGARQLEILIVDRDGAVIATTGCQPVH